MSVSNQVVILGRIWDIVIALADDPIFNETADPVQTLGGMTGPAAAMPQLEGGQNDYIPETPQITEFEDLSDGAGQPSMGQAFVGPSTIGNESLTDGIESVGARSKSFDPGSQASGMDSTR